jgi:hypothetical protein
MIPDVNVEMLAMRFTMPNYPFRWKDFPEIGYDGPNKGSACHESSSSRGDFRTASGAGQPANTAKLP